MCSGEELAGEQAYDQTLKTSHSFIAPSHDPDDSAASFSSFIFTDISSSGCRCDSNRCTGCRNYCSTISCSSRSFFDCSLISSSAVSTCSRSSAILRSCGRRLHHGVIKPNVTLRGMDQGDSDEEMEKEDEEEKNDDYRADDQEARQQCSQS